MTTNMTNQVTTATSTVVSIIMTRKIMITMTTGKTEAIITKIMITTEENTMVTMVIQRKTTEINITMTTIMTWMARDTRSMTLPIMSCIQVGNFLKPKRRSTKQRVYRKMVSFTGQQHLLCPHSSPCFGWRKFRATVLL